MSRKAFRLAVAALVALVLTPLADSAFGSPSRAEAHPLGNFTVNRYARLLLGSDAISLRYIIDMAEIPAFQEIRSIDANGDSVLDDAETAAYLAHKTPGLVDGLELSVSGQRQSLGVVQQSISFPEGQGGLKTLRLVLDLQAAAAAGWQEGAYASLEDSNYSDRLGWKQIIIQAGSGVALTRSSVSTVDETAELTVYPSERLKSPPDVSSARFRFQAGDPSTTPALIPSGSSTQAPSQGPSMDRFARLISEQSLTPAFVVLSLFAAAAWGAAHALGPGHGKTVVAAYLVGSRGTARHALLLGLTVTITHTSTVIIVGVATLYASRFFPTEDLYLWLSVASGLMVAVMGGLLFYTRLRRLLASRVTAHGHSHQEHAHHTHDDAHGHDHDHEHAHGHSHDDHGHSHELKAPGMRGLLLLGISGGLLPCPTALVVMLGAIALDRVAYGLVLILAFSVGLAAVLTAIGILMVYAGRALDGASRLGRVAAFTTSTRWLQALPLLSSLTILAVGLVLTQRAVAAI